MRKTTNYGLTLYDKEDKMSITASENSLNANMEIIDNELKDKASRDEIPSIEGLATEEYVDNVIANIPTGDGSEEWELIVDDTLEEDVISLEYTNLNHKNIYILIEGTLKDITYEGYNYEQAMILLEINKKQCMRLLDSMMFVNQKDKINWHIDKVANTCRVLFHRVLGPSNGAGVCINADIPDCPNGINRIMLRPNLSVVHEGIYQNLGRFTAGTKIKIYGIKN